MTIRPSLPVVNTAPSGSASPTLDSASLETPSTTTAEVPSACRTVPAWDKSAVQDSTKKTKRQGRRNIFRTCKVTLQTLGKSTCFARNFIAVPTNSLYGATGPAGVGGSGGRMRASSPAAIMAAGVSPCREPTDSSTARASPGEPICSSNFASPSRASGAA